MKIRVELRDVGMYELSGDIDSIINKISNFKSDCIDMGLKDIEIYYDQYRDPYNEQGKFVIFGWRQATEDEEKDRLAKEESDRGLAEKRDRELLAKLKQKYE